MTSHSGCCQERFGGCLFPRPQAPEANREDDKQLARADGCSGVKPGNSPPHVSLSAVTDQPQAQERRPRASLGRSSRSRNKNWLRHGLSEEVGQGGSVRATGGEGKDPALRLDRAADTQDTPGAGQGEAPAAGPGATAGRCKGRPPAGVCPVPGSSGGRGRGAGTGAGIAPIERQPLAGLWGRTRRGEQIGRAHV